MRTIMFFMLFLFAASVSAQSYFPPNDSSEWDTLSPSSLDWCPEKIDSLYAFLNETNSKSFILLKDGKIVLEQYFDEHTDSSFWYWASAGKTLSSFLVGIAQEEGFLNVNDTTSDYLGSGWTYSSPEEEEKITIWNQLTMTSGLDDGVSNPFCSDDSCLIYLAAPETRWAYHNAPYTLLRPVLENATGQGINIYANQRLLNPIGMDGVFSYVGYDNVFSSTTRSMARFGLLIQNNGEWDGTQILSDEDYFSQLVNTSQALNESYGYLWWLNGKSSFMLPGSQFVFDGSIFPNAPNDVIAALGKNGQIINVVPSENMVWVRMGNASSTGLVETNLNIGVWNYINDLSCVSTVESFTNTNSKKLIKIVDVFGREANELKNTPLFYLYEGGLVEKKIIIE
ncbi:beta-lactamase family protein [Flavobacteriales bacterium]|nr:beta-lactamase family protein [Flavobacteriales bacterium]